MLSAGQRNVRIRFEQATETAGPGGGVSRVWSTLSTEWAFVERVRSLVRDVERLTAGGESARPVVRVHVSAHSATRAVDGKCRAINLDTGEVMDIQGPGQDLTGDRRDLTFTAVISGVF